MIPAETSARLFLCAILLPAWVWAAPSEEEMFFKGVSEVNEGGLRFLPSPPEKPVHHHQNHVFLGEDSLNTGWVRLEQCHQHLDPVPSMQIVYNRERIRDIRVERRENIGKAWVHEHTVQMEQVEANALICIRAETRALSSDGEGIYSLANGPYMRRFLDGYYPMRVSMKVSIETPRIGFLDVEPRAQPGFAVSQHVNEVGYDAWFEGRLTTLIRFRRNPD